MRATYTLARPSAAGATKSPMPRTWRRVHFPQCPLPLPSAEDLASARQLPRQLHVKNVSYPESDRLHGVKDDLALRERVSRAQGA
jgi:hypothetical protein